MDYSRNGFNNGHSESGDASKDQSNGGRGGSRIQLAFSARGGFSNVGSKGDASEDQKSSNSFPSRGGFGQKSNNSFSSRSGFNQQPSSGGFGQQQSSFGGFGQQQSSSGGVGNQQPSSGGFGNQQPLSGGFGQSSSKGFGQQQQSSGGFGQPSSGGFGVGKQQSSTSFGQPSSGGFGWQQPSSKGFGYATQPSSKGFGAGNQQQPSSGGFGAQPSSGGFGNQQPSSGGFGQQSGRDNIVAYESKINELEAQIRQKIANEFELKNKNRELERELEAKIRQSNAKESELKSECSELKIKLKLMKVDESDLENQYSELEEKHRQANNQLSALNHQTQNDAKMRTATKEVVSLLKEMNLSENYSLKEASRLIIASCVEKLGNIENVSMNDAFVLPSQFDEIVEYLRKERIKNVGAFKEPSETKMCATRLNFAFPPEYKFLKRLNSFDEKTLSHPDRVCLLNRYDKETLSHPDHNIWSLLVSKPTDLKVLAEKEMAMVCVACEKAEMEAAQKPVIKAATLKLNEDVNNMPDYLCFPLEFTLHLIEGGDFVGIRLQTSVTLKLWGGRNIFEGYTFKVSKKKRDDFICLKRELTGREKMAKENGKALIQPDQREEFMDLDNMEVSAFECFYDFIYQAKGDAAKHITNLEFYRVTHPEFLPTDDAEFGIKQFEDSFNKELPKLMEDTGLDIAQSKALYAICTQSHRRAPFLLNGPPGTGKTRTIAQTVCYILAMHDNNNVLLVAPSNMAIDALALEMLKLVDGGMLKRENVVLLKSSSAEYEQRDKRLDDITLKDFDKESFTGPSYKHTGQSLERRIVITTLGSSPHIRKFELREDYFSHIFVDEAAQASHSEFWIPIRNLKSKDTSIILCGDPKQLEPVNEVDFLFEVNRAIESAFSRYMSMPEYSNDPRYYCFLNKSYGRHKAIVGIVSELFYNWKLSVAKDSHDKLIDNWRGLPNKNFPILFIDVPYGKEREGSKSSDGYSNAAEAIAIAEYANCVSDDLRPDSKDIGIISQYQYQRALVVKKLKDLDLHNVLVDSVERFQGSKRKIILMTTTRTIKPGFLFNSHKFNTAITRASHLLIVVGNKKLLDSVPSWKRFISMCKDNGSMITWDGEVQFFPKR